MAEKKMDSALTAGSMSRSIYGTTYIVTGTYSPSAKETGRKKIEKLILQDFRNSSKITATVLPMAAQKKGVQHD